MTKRLIIVLLLAAASGTPLRAQLWSGVVDADRAVSWQSAGVAGGIPNRTTICETLSPGATAAQISTAITNCTAGQVVFLNAGTYTLTAAITWDGRSDVTLRGAGANSTFLVFTGNTGCRGRASNICIATTAAFPPFMPDPSSTTTWTAGYAQGTTSITVGSASGISVGTLLILDQLNDSDASQSGNDIFVCTSLACTDEGGGGNGRDNRAQQQLVRVTNIAGNVLTITPDLHMPNWRSGQSPGLSFGSQSPTNNGIEDLSIQNNASGSQWTIVLMYGYNNWVKGIRSLNSNRAHVLLDQQLNSTVRDSYFYGTENAQSQSYGVESFSTGSNLIENNIFQHITAPIMMNSGGSGTVVGYNFSIDDYYAASANWMQSTMHNHEGGIGMNLHEGNDGLGFAGDRVHGTHNMITLFRNHLYGDIWNDPPKTSNTAVLNLFDNSRFYNVIGNVLGRAAYYNTYAADSDTAIYSSSNARVLNLAMRWGNYDTVTGTSRFEASEVPSGLAIYDNPVPASQTLPASFYLAAQPTTWWTTPWGTPPWPPIGPDVTGGAYTAGHAYDIPARRCWFNSSVDPAYAVGTIIIFSASTCYQAGSPPAPVLKIVHIVNNE